ncbi:MAG TPA: lipocalin-like domain-containing protein [Pseudolabrys sp.]|nr:lipocalin-like domain-containing protein [Pseudolabrys sp.]
MRNEDLVGVWRERGRELVRADGSVKADVPRASQIMYTADGFMSVVNTPIGRARVNETAARMDLDAASAEERAQAAIGVVAYAGRFEVKGDRVFHHIFTAVNPNRVGDAQERLITLSGDDLTLTAPPDAQGNSFRIHWRRAGKT